MQCFCQLPCSTTTDGLFVCNHYTSNHSNTVCLFILHNVNMPHFQDSVIPIVCQCARCLATLSIAKRVSYNNGVLIPFNHVQCYACGNFCTLKQSEKANQNQTRFYVTCASNHLKLQSSTMPRPVQCRTFFSWADDLRTPPNRSISEHVNPLPILKRNNDDENNTDEGQTNRMEQILSSDHGPDGDHLL